jgi:hypothetical protein
MVAELEYDTAPVISRLITRWATPMTWPGVTTGAVLQAAPNSATAASSATAATRALPPVAL